jgi:hypothetical protein
MRVECITLFENIARENAQKAQIGDRERSGTFLSGVEMHGFRDMLQAGSLL